MAEACESTSSSLSHAEPSPSTTTPKEKPVVMRVKRKASQTPLDALWLEISERPSKKVHLELGKLSFTDFTEKENGMSVTKRVMMQHVETVGNSEAMSNLLESCLLQANYSRKFSTRNEERKNVFKQDRRQEQLRLSARQKHERQEQLRLSARQKHEVQMRSARFEQIWKSRRSDGEGQEDFIHELCHVYDVVRVDDDEMEEQVDASVEDDAILCNYLPLIREHLPTAAEKIESDIRASTQDGYVYDIYTIENDLSANAEDAAEYPVVQVNDDDCYIDPSEADYETDDSNAENNPLNDYPDEETSEDEGEERTLSDDAGAHREDAIYTSEEEAQDWRWSYR